MTKERHPYNAAPPATDSEWEMHPWRQHPKEPADAFNAFLLWLMPHDISETRRTRRTIRQTAFLAGAGYQSAYKWSTGAVGGHVMLPMTWKQRRTALEEHETLHLEEMVQDVRRRVVEARMYAQLELCEMVPTATKQLKSELKAAEPNRARHPYIKEVFDRVGVQPIDVTAKDLETTVAAYDPSRLAPSAQRLLEAMLGVACGEGSPQDVHRELMRAADDAESDEDDDQPMSFSVDDD